MFAEELARNASFDFAPGSSTQTLTAFAPGAWTKAMHPKSMGHFKLQPVCGPIGCILGVLSGRKGLERRLLCLSNLPNTALLFLCY